MECSQGPFMNTLDMPEQCHLRLVQDSLLSMTCTTTPPEVVFYWLYPLPQDSGLPFGFSSCQNPVHTYEEVELMLIIIMSL